MKTHKKHKVLGILDIYGFEAFEHNGFEQFIINFANEKLQQVFIDATFRREQVDIISEGIQWNQVHAQKNSKKVFFFIFVNLICVYLSLPLELNFLRLLTLFLLQIGYFSNCVICSLIERSSQGILAQLDIAANKLG